MREAWCRALSSPALLLVFRAAECRAACPVLFGDVTHGQSRAQVRQTPGIFDRGDVFEGAPCRVNQTFAGHELTVSGRCSSAGRTAPGER